jgi:DNA-binding CsgD family transcriptional regulator
LLRAQIVSASGSGSEAPAQLLRAARRLEPLDVALARETYLDAWGAAFFAGDPSGPASVAVVSRAARSAPRPTGRPHASDLLLDGLALLNTDGRAAAAPVLRQAVSEYMTEDLSLEKGLQWGVLASTAAMEIWDFDHCENVITRQVELARAAGALAPLSVALNGRGIVVAWRGDLSAAARVIVEADAVTEATRTRVAPYGAMLHAALRGREAEARARIDTALDHARSGGEGLAVQWANWSTAVLHNGLGRYDEALAAARVAGDENQPGHFVTIWALPELIEAATRTGRPELCAGAVERFAASATVTGTDWGLGVLARCRALLATDDEAEPHYREAVDRLSGTRLRPELARAHLLYGEWLRLRHRRADARTQLELAHSLFAAMGLDGFAHRARHELVGAGANLREVASDQPDELTPQEDHIARLAREGRTNVQIGAELYLSPRTVEWHLKKVFAKLGITSRRALQDALPATSRGTTSV